MMAPKAVLYARVSSDEQADAGTIALQLDAIPRWAERHGIEIVGEYLDDGYTGTVMLYERPGGAQLLKDAAELRARGVSLILLYNWRRLGREPWVVWGAIHQLEKLHGLRIKSISEEADTSTPERVMLLCIGTGNASMERAHTVKITREGSLLWAKRGAWMGGPTPYGYRVRRDGRRGYLEPNEELIPGIDPAFGLTWAGVVRQVFTWSADGMTHRAICDRLDTLGVPSSQGDGMGRRPVASRWYPARLQRLLRSPIYRGEFQYGRTRTREIVNGEVPPLVSPEVWHAASETSRLNLKRSGRNVQQEYLLRGLLVCEVCGRRLTGVSNRNGKSVGYTRYYRCAGVGNDPPFSKCSTYASADTVEREVWSILERHAKNPDEALEVIQRERQQELRLVTVLVAQLETLRASVKESEAHRAQVIDWARRRIITEADLERQLAQIGRESEGVRKEVARLESELQQAALTEAQLAGTRQLLLEVRECLGTNPTWERRRALVLRALDRVVVRMGGRRYHREVTVFLYYAGTRV